MEANSRCALRSGAGTPASDLCKLGCIVGIGMTIVNGGSYSICMSRTTHIRQGAHTNVKYPCKSEGLQGCLKNGLIGEWEARSGQTQISGEQVTVSSLPRQ